VAATFVLLVLTAGCGGSSSGGSRWEVLSRSVLSSGTSLARADGSASDPAKLQMRVVASPNVTTTVTYDVICGSDTIHGTASGKTTFVAPIPVPPGQDSQESHGRFCDVHVSATRPTATATTVTIEMIPVPAAPTTT
jgi:hypothetical protein